MMRPRHMCVCNVGGGAFYLSPSRRTRPSFTRKPFVLFAVSCQPPAEMMGEGKQYWNIHCTQEQLLHSVVSSMHTRTANCSAPRCIARQLTTTALLLSSTQCFIAAAFRTCKRVCARVRCATATACTWKQQCM